jgi:NIPSNAP
VIYELRTYRANEGRLPDLQARFRDHTCRLFERHGIHNVGYWTNLAGGRNDELTYMVAYEDLGARQPAWAEFIADPEWQQAYAESEKDGGLTHHLRNRLFNPTDFSPLR